MTVDLARYVDQQAIRDVIAAERAARDARDWDAMQACYTDDCVVETTWFRGTAREFVAASRQRIARTTSFHYVWPARVDLRADRALAESPMEIHIRSTVKAVEVDVVSHARLLNRMVRTPQGWKVASFDAIYRTDEARCIDPDQRLPLTWDEIAPHRSSYRMMTWLVSHTGIEPNHELLGDDRPDQSAAFLATARAWLTAPTS